MRQLALALLLCLLPLQASRAEAGPTLVTVAGAIAKSNRGPLEPFRDALLVRIVDPFASAYAFDAAALAALPQQELTASYPNWDGKPHSFSGPSLADLLAAVAATGDSVTFIAFDGYSASFERSELERRGYILATAMDGQPLGLGGYGPAWLMVARADEKTEDDAGLVWATIFILVE